MTQDRTVALTGKRASENALRALSVKIDGFAGAVPTMERVVDVQNLSLCVPTATLSGRPDRLKRLLPCIVVCDGLPVLLWLLVVYLL